MSEDKVRTKDSCWSVGTIYDSRELPGVSTADLGIGRGVTCINLQGDLNLDFRYPTLVGSYKVSNIRLWNPNASFVSLALRPQISSNYFIIFTHKHK
jgi:hypothetical protein